MCSKNLETKLFPLQRATISTRERNSNVFPHFQHHGQRTPTVSRRDTCRTMATQQGNNIVMGCGRRPNH
jgi:hypothetical protein